MTDDLLKEWLTATGAAEGVEPFLRWAPPGHFYSPVPGSADLDRRAAKSDLPGIDLRPDEQLAQLSQLAGHLDGFNPPAHPEPGWRYHSDNPMLAIGDALVLHALIRSRGPSKIIEVGSGWSSAVMLDTADRFLGQRPHLTFIDPYPANLTALLSAEDRANVTIIEQPVQTVPVEVLTGLTRSDILFIDSSHVVKTGSDVNYLFFEVLPRLAPGVAVHIHDIFYPFEIPDAWLTEGRMWAETYLLRGLLTDTAAWRILIWNNYLASVHPQAVADLLPAAVSNPGASIWIERC